MLFGQNKFRILCYASIITLTFSSDAFCRGHSYRPDRSNQSDNDISITENSDRQQKKQRPKDMTAVIDLSDILSKYSSQLSKDPSESDIKSISKKMKKMDIGDIQISIKNVFDQIDFSEKDYIQNVKSRITKLNTILSKTNLDNQIIYTSLESAMQMAVLNTYLHNQISKISYKTIEKLPIPKFSFTIKKNKVVYDEKHQKTKLSRPRYSSEQLEELFKKETEVDVLSCGRTIVNMSGIHNMCGYYAILSQIDQSCAGNALSAGKNKVLDLDTLEKVCQLRLAIAVGSLNEKSDKPLRGSLLKSALEDKCNGLGISGRGLDYDESSNGALDSLDLSFLAEALNKTIAIISDQYILYGGIGASLEIRYPDGTIKEYHSLLIDDEDMKNKDSNSFKDKQNALKEVLMSDAIVLYHVNRDHYTSVQKIPSEK